MEPPAGLREQTLNLAAAKDTPDQSTRYEHGFSPLIAPDRPD